jgi:hypothetical protein
MNSAKDEPMPFCGLSALGAIPLRRPVRYDFVQEIDFMAAAVARC